MAFLGLLVVASLFAADADDLQPVGAAYDPSQGIFFDCASISLPNNPSFEQKEATKQKCIDTKWCIWNTAGTTGNCIRDECLKYLGDTDADMAECRAITFLGVSCQVRYLEDGVNCDSGNFEPIQTSRFCRAPDNAAYAREVIDSCFYTDLKGIGQNWATAGNRVCTGATCSNKTSSGGGYCAVTGSDCSVFDKDTDDYCNCLGSNNCDLYPRCFKNSSSSCIFDSCSLITLSSTEQNEDAKCRSGGIAVDSCKVRPQNFYNKSSNKVEQEWVCVNKDKTHANECYYAVKSAISGPDVPAGKCAPNTYVPCDYCKKVTYDETVCSTAKTLANDKGEGVNPGGSNHYAWSDEANCTLVDIAPNYIGSTQGKYCTDGDRTVPSPDAGSLVGVPSVMAFALVLLAVIVL